MLVATVIMLVFGAVGIILWIGGHDVVAGKISAGQLSAFVFYAVDRRGRRRHDQRSDRRPAARGGGDRAAVRTARGRARDTGAGAPGRAARRRRAAPWRSIGPLPLSVAAATRRRSTTSRSTSRRAKTSRSSARRAPARRRYSSCCCASTIRSGARAHRRRRRAQRRSARGARRLAVVPQDPVIFAASVLENVRYGRPDASEAEVRAACDAAFATEFIAQLPQALREQPRRARRAAFRRAAAATRDRARDSRRPARSCCSTRRRARSTPRASAWSSSRSSG